MQQPPTRSRAPRLGRLLAYLFLVLGALVVAAPFLYALSTSLKSNSEALGDPLQLLPQSPQWVNYVTPFATTPLARQFLNSIVVAVAVTLLNVVTCTMAGYSFAKFQYFGRDALFLGVLATLMMPIQVILVPLYSVVLALGWLNTYAGLIIPAGTSAFGVFLMRQYFQTVPSELLEAARIDGAGELRIFVQVVLPLVRPAVSALVIFIFINNWNSLLWPILVTTNQNMFTLPLGIASFQGTYATNFPELSAVALLTTAPVFVVFLLLQRQFIRGMALSGIKG